MARVMVEASHDGDPGAATVVQLAVGESHTLALTASGSVYTWGRGQFGRQGMGVFQDELEPTLVEIGMEPDDYDAGSATEIRASDSDFADRPRVTQIAAGSYHSLALSDDGTVWSWGFNAYGQLGRQRGASYPSPIAFSEENRKNAASGTQPKVAMVEAGAMMSSAIDEEGGLWLWGAAPQPAADAADAPTSRLESTSFELASIDKPQRVLAFAGRRVHRVACGSEHVLALVDARNGVQCYAWGGNAYGQLGLGDFGPRDSPNVVAALGPVGAIVDFACGFYHSVVVKDSSRAEFADQGTNNNNNNHTTPLIMDQVMASPKLRARNAPEQYMVSPRMRLKQGYAYDSNVSTRIPNQQRNNNYSVASDASSRGHLVNSVSNWGGLPLRTQASQAKRDAQSARLSTCWTFGQNENGQLGTGSRVNSPTPGVVDALPTHERIHAVSCGLFHTAVVLESGDVWVWGMEGGLGQCPGIGPPGSKSGDALTPVRVFGESSAKYDPLWGAKGIACGGAHTVTVANDGKDLWAWGRGKNGVLGLGHHSDSWFPSPVLWPPAASGYSKELDTSDRDPMYENRKSRSRGSSRGRGDEIRPYYEESNKPPRSNSFSRSSGEQFVREVREVEAAERPPRGQVASIRKALESSPGRPSRRGDQFWPPVHPDPETSNPRSFRRETGSATTEPSTITSMSPSMRGFKYQTAAVPATEDLTALKAELAECRRYAENLHAAVYGGLETFALPLPGKHDYYDARKRDANGAKSSALQEWQQHVEEAPLDELAKLEAFYKGMRNKLKDMLFQRKMEDWCRRAMSGAAASSYQEPPPVREPYSVQNTPYFDGPGELALRMSDILSDRGEMLPPAALAASINEFRMQSQRHRR